MLRQEAAIANVAALICVAAGIKNKTTGQPMTASDFMPWVVDPKEPISFEDAILKLGVIHGV